jgi:hypothetical protein
MQTQTLAMATVPDQYSKVQKSHYETVTMTPALAKELLALNVDNRRLDSRRIKEYADTMRLGRWHGQSTDAIAVSKDKRLMNGQHRLHAVVAFGGSVQMLVLWNCDPSIFDVIDCGRPRNVADIVRRGVSKYGTEIAAIAALIMIDRDGGGGFAQLNARQKRPNSERSDMVRFCIENQDLLIKCASWASSISPLIPKSQAGYLAWKLYEKNEHVIVDKFLSRFNNTVAARQLDITIGAAVNQLTSLRINSVKSDIGRNSYLLNSAFEDFLTGRVRSRLLYKAAQ